MIKTVFPVLPIFLSNEIKTLSLKIPVISQWRRGSSDSPECFLFHRHLMILLWPQHSKKIRLTCTKCIIQSFSWFWLQRSTHDWMHKNFMASLMYEFTCGGPGFYVSCTMDDYILGFSLLGCTQAIPDVKGIYYKAKPQTFTLQHWTFDKINE